MQFVSPYFAFTYLVKHKHETSEQDLGIYRDNSHLVPRQQVREPAIRVESKLTSLQRETSISSANEWVSFGQVTFNHREVLIWNEMSHQVIGGFTILAD